MYYGINLCAIGINLFMLGIHVGFDANSPDFGFTGPRFFYQYIYVALLLICSMLGKSLLQGVRSNIFGLAVLLSAIFQYRFVYLFRVAQYDEIGPYGSLLRQTAALDVIALLIITGLAISELLPIVSFFRKTKRR